MPDNTEKLSILSQLDDAEKSDIISDEELEEIGVAYGSKEKYFEAMRIIQDRLSGTPVGRRNVSVRVGNGKTVPRVNSGKTTVPFGNLPGIKKINIVGKVINTAGDAAQLFALFRDPRAEILNVAYTSKSGEVLAHTAWTCGLPGITASPYGYTPNDGFSYIRRMKDRLNADKIWIAHNHPSGNPEPSFQDIEVTKVYAAHFQENFAGHVVLDHSEFYMIFGNGTSLKCKLKEDVKNYIPKSRERSAIIDSPELIAGMFKKILSKNNDAIAFAVLDGRHRIVSWIYGNSKNVIDIKNYMRISGGSCVIVLTNSNKIFRNFADISNQSANSEYDIFLDIIRVNRHTGVYEKSHYRKGANWQSSQQKEIQFVINNHTLQYRLDFDSTKRDNKFFFQKRSKICRTHYRKQTNSLKEHSMYRQMGLYKLRTGLNLIKN